MTDFYYEKSICILLLNDFNVIIGSLKVKILIVFSQESPLIHLRWINTRNIGAFQRSYAMRCAKAGAGIGALGRAKLAVPADTLQVLYKALVQPYFDYCSPLWENCGTLLKGKLKKFQSRPTSVIAGATYDIRSADVLETLSSENLSARRLYIKSVFMYKILNNYTAPTLTSLYWYF